MADELMDWSVFVSKVRTITTMTINMSASSAHTVDKLGNATTEHLVLTQFE